MGKHKLARGRPTKRDFLVLISVGLTLIPDLPRRKRRQDP